MDFLNAFSGISGVKGAFTTREGGISPIPFHSLNLGLKTNDTSGNLLGNWSRILDNIDLNHKKLRIPELQHGSNLVLADDFNHVSGIPADAVWTDNKQYVLAVTMADCLPVLIFDPVDEWIACVHAGWKGTSGEILLKTILTVCGIKHSNPAHCLVSFGPAICWKHFEIGEKVSDLLPNRCLKHEKEKIFADLLLENRFQALDAGILPENIINHSFCTWERTDLFFSHRKEGPLTGRCAALVALA